MYYSSTKSVVYAIKFTVHNSNNEDQVKQEVAATVPVGELPLTADAVSQIPVQPLTAEELKEMIDKTRMMKEMIA